ncbi:hypothetical protein [Lactiplantibacillus plajomi]|uniref:Uncharacterized protein n=1 Tax=Lactiplantibacillus plajomi TaxID=1457217 RepID=A0ABV6K4X3_9LACO|nr:hypothetical protein [Lactiplantibacillus plajomi]
MAKYKDSVLTTAGLALASSAYAGKTTFKLTRTTTTAEKLTTDKIRPLSALPIEKQEGLITQGDSVVTHDHTLITAELYFTNQDLSAGYEVNAIGVYAQETGADEILYSVIIADQPEYMPDFSDKVLMEFKTTVTMAVGQIDAVIIEMATDGLATRQYVDNTLKQAKSYADTGDSQALTAAKEYTDSNLPASLDDRSFAVDISMLNVNDFPHFRAWGYYNGAGIAQTTAYAGVPLMTEFTLSVDLKENGEVMIPKLVPKQIETALPDFDTSSFTVSVASDGEWLYLISEPATIGIQCLNAKFKREE